MKQIHIGNKLKGIAAGLLSFVILGVVAFGVVGLSGVRRVNIWHIPHSYPYGRI